MAILLSMFLTFLATSVWGSQVDNEHAAAMYQGIAIFASAVVGAFVWLLKFLLTRDRAGIDQRFVDMEDRLNIRINELLVKKREDRTELIGMINNLGVKVEHLTDIIDKKVDAGLESLKEHDAELFEKFDVLNRELGVLLGEHRSRTNCDRQ